MKEFIRCSKITFFSLLFVSGLIMLTCFIGLTAPAHLIGIAMVAIGGFGLCIM